MPWITVSLVCLPVVRKCKGTIYTKYTEHTSTEADEWVSRAGAAGMESDC